jgi:hypothetical protein
MGAKPETIKDLVDEYFKDSETIDPKYMEKFVGEYFSKVNQANDQKDKAPSKSEEDESKGFEEAVKNGKFAVTDLLKS